MEHSTHVVLPLLDWYWPPLHLGQTGVAVKGEARPGGQGEHSADCGSLYLATEHRLHSNKPSSSVYLPATQIWNWSFTTCSEKQERFEIAILKWE